MSTKHLRYSLSLSRLPSDCCSLAKSILADEHSNNERSFLNSLLAYGFVNRKKRNSNFFSTSFIGNTSDEKNHQFSMPIHEENQLFVDHIQSFKQGKLRTTEYNYLLFCGFNTFIEICKRHFFSEKYQLINLQNEIKNEIYLSGLYPFFLTFNRVVEVKESEEKYFFDVFKTSINEMFNTNFLDFKDFVSHSTSSDQSDASYHKQKIPIPIIHETVLASVVHKKNDEAKLTTEKTQLKRNADESMGFNENSPLFIEEKPALVEKKQNDSADVDTETGQSANTFWKSFI